MRQLPLSNIKRAISPDDFMAGAGDSTSNSQTHNVAVRFATPELAANTDGKVCSFDQRFVPQS